MAVNGGRRLPSLGKPANASSAPSSRSSVKLSIFWNLLDASPPSMPNADYNTDWLERCLQELEDAHTVDSAIAWHTETLNELGRHIAAVRFKPWPHELRRDTAFHLMHLRLELRDGLSNLQMAR